MIRKSTRNFQFLIILLFVISCKKETTTVPAPIDFEVIGKDGNSIIHSLKDNLAVTYTQNGVVYTRQLNVYKVQVSATDTTRVSKYNGFVITDRNPADNQGFISSPSGAGVRSFTLLLNGVNAGTINLNYWGYLSTPYPHSPSSTFTFNNADVSATHLVGAYSNGARVMLNTDANGDYVYLLQQ